MELALVILNYDKQSRLDVFFVVGVLRYDLTFRTFMLSVFLDQAKTKTKLKELVSLHFIITHGQIQIIMTKDQTNNKLV